MAKFHRAEPSPRAHRDTSNTSRLNSILQLVSLGAVLVGCMVLISWALRLPGLNRIHPLLGVMNSHTAFCFVLAGTSLWLSRKEPTRGWKLRAAQAAATVVILVSVFTLSQRWGFGIDQLVQGSIGQIFPGRMPVATALAFLALGLALLFLDLEVGHWRPAEFLSCAAGLLSLLALIAYVFSFVSVFDIANRRPLAFHTVLLLLAFSFGILAARPRRGLMQLATGNSIAGVMTRRMLPAAVGVPVLLGWLVMEGQRGGLYPSALNLPYYALSFVVVFSTLVWLTAISLLRIDIQREGAERQVRRLNAELEQRVVERTAQLESANKELEAFSYSVSHDLRAPLRAISGFSELLVTEHSRELGSEGTDHLQRVLRASRRMGQLIDDLLSLSRVTRDPMRRVTLDLTAMAGEIVAEFRRSDPENRVQVRIEPHLEAEGDPNLMRIVMDNLLRNAWKFSRKTPEPRIEVGAVSRDGRTTFVIKDNGAGFDMAYAHKLFGAFQRLHSEAEFEGTGIGLVTIQRIIHRHGGRVWAEGAVGAGATFYFSI
jgi:signal transduction histidine kinase